MPEYNDFEEFARDLFLFGFRVPMNVREINDLTYSLSDFMIQALEVVQRYGHIHCSKIKRLLDRSFQKGRFKEFGTDEEFMRFIIPKCLIDDENYFYSLMLVAAFINELTNILYRNKGCFRFVHTGYKCFAAVFNRRFRARFEAHGGFKGLDKYFRSVCGKGIDETKEDYYYMKLLNGCDRDSTLKVADLIRNGNDGSDRDFILSDYELSMAEDAEATKKEWFDETIDYSPLNGNDATGMLEDGDYPILEDEEESLDFEIEALGSKAKNIFEHFAFNCLILTKTLPGHKFDQLMSPRKCNWCGTHCYQYAKYTTRKYIGLALDCFN